MTFTRSPLARVGTQALLLVIALPLASKASAVVMRGFGVLAAFLVICMAIAAPIALDLWAKVEANTKGIRWRNTLLTRRLAWSEVAGFEHGSGSTLLRRADGKAIPLRVLGRRYFGSKRLATQRVELLEQLLAASR